MLNLLLGWWLVDNFQTTEFQPLLHQYLYYKFIIQIGIFRNESISASLSPKSGFFKMSQFWKSGDEVEDILSKGIFVE